MSETQNFNGSVYYACRDRGYFSRKNPSTEYMHRDVWAYHNGPIPIGYHIHHIDEDKANNSIENLACMSASDHSKLHAKTNSWVGSAENKAQLIEAGKKSKEWHGSAEGLAWHSKNGKAAWADRKMHEKKCEQCGGDYVTPYPNKSMFCHVNCKQKFAYHRRINAQP